jgi:hypothetical protein
MDFPLSQINDAKIDALGIFTKSHVTLKAQALQRSHDFLLQDQSSMLLPKERVSNCLKRRIDKNKGRFVKYNEERCKAHWANVQRCGSIWVCPVCAKQITEKRREELKQGIETFKTGGGYVFMMTLTFSHSPNQPLKSLLDGQKKAYKFFNETTKVQAIFEAMGVGTKKINAKEITYGQNGWHPHQHILLLSHRPITDSYKDAMNIQDINFDENTKLNQFVKYHEELSQIWIKCCKKAGLQSPTIEYGLDIRDGKYAAQYVSKWGLENEMTKGHIKKGRVGGLTPFDLLQLSFDESALVHDKFALRLYQEYGVATKGLRQLVWSRGLKSLLCIEEKTDEELAQETENMGITLEEVPQLIFSLLCKYQKRHTYLTALENDYSSGNYGTLSSESYLLIEDLAKREISFIQSHY